MVDHLEMKKLCGREVSLYLPRSGIFLSGFANCVFQRLNACQYTKDQADKQ
jgi:hypothetical protein